MRCSVGKPWALALMWMQIWPTLATQTPSLTKNAFSPSQPPQQENVPCPATKKCSGMTGRTWLRDQELDLAYSGRKSVGCVIHLGPTQHPTGLKGSATNDLVPDTTGHCRRSCVRVLTGQSCFVSARGTYTVLAMAKESESMILDTPMSVTDTFLSFQAVV